MALSDLSPSASAFSGADSFKAGARAFREKVSPVAAILGGRKRKKQKAGLIAQAAEETARAKSEMEARNKAKLEAYGAETELRGGLIAAQRGGLASTILNLGGAAGDPNQPFASQLVGTTAEGPRPELETKYRKAAYNRLTGLEYFY